MSEAVVAKRYADALFQLATEKNTTDALVAELQVVRQAFQENNQLNTFLMHPRVNNADKKQFIDEVFQGLSKDVIHTIKLLVERHRIDNTTAIIDQFIDMVNDAKGVAKAVVYSVRELTDAEKKDLESTFAKRLNKNAIDIENVVDPSVLGGMKIHIGNTIYDGSISGKLRRIERNLKLANNR